MLSNYYCEGNPTLFGTFDLSYAPTLIFYAYIPIIIVSLFLGIFVLVKNKYSIQSKLLFLIALFFSLWNLNIIFEWITVPINLNLFFWEITMFLEMPIFLFSIYFTHTFLNKSDISLKTKLVLGTLWLPVVFLLATKMNIINFDVLNCQATVGYLTYYVYFFEIVSIVWIIIFSIKKFLNTKIKTEHQQIVVLATGLAIFLSIFSLSNILGEFTKVYEINLFGPIGMVIFLGLLSYMIVKFKTFNVKLMATQALVWGLVILIGSQFFFIKIPINMVLNGFTFVSSIIFGYLLIKSVKKEVKQKEELVELNVYLENLLKQRESLVHLITHKVKGSFTHSKYIFAGMLDGSFGEVTPELKKYAKLGLESDNTGIETVDLVLNAANLTKGTVTYDMKVIDFKNIIEKIIEDKKIGAESKGLTMETEIKNGNYNIVGDIIWLKEAMNNLIENSIKYTKAGKINIGLENLDGKIQFFIKDTGIGITDEDKKILFTEGGRGKDSVKINVDSTGYGLYTVKLIIEAHKGKVYAESEVGKGSTFFVELPSIK